MRDKNGLLIRCKHSDWKIIDDAENHDYVCTHFGDKIISYHACYADEYCRFYEPERSDNDGHV